MTDVDAEGQQYTKVDMGPMMSAVGAGGAFGDGLGMEAWVDGTTMYADLGSLGSMMGAGGVSVPEGIFTVDLLAFADVVGEMYDGADVASALTGQAAPDPVEMANTLKEVLADADADGSTYTGTITFVDYLAAMGEQIDDLSSGMTGGVDQFVDIEALMDIFEEIEVDVSVTVANGAADVITFDIDMTPMFAGLGDVAGGDAEMAGLGDLFGDASMSMQMIMDYDIDASIDVVIPEGDFPDATSDFTSMLSMGDVTG